MPAHPLNFRGAVGPSRSSYAGPAREPRTIAKGLRNTSLGPKGGPAEAPRRSGAEALGRRKPFGEFGRLVDGRSGMADVVRLVSARRLDANAHLQDAQSRVAGGLRHAERAGERRRSRGRTDAGVARRQCLPRGPTPPVLRGRDAV